MMSPGGAAVQTSDDGSAGNKRTPCPVHGCKRVYTDHSALESHLKDHETPALSLPGKVLLCSTVGCSGSFPNMQKLMEHMRHHHKPNIFFQCESCRTKLRSYRGLLTHLHTCSKVPRGKTKPAEPTPPQPAAATNPNVTPGAMAQDPPQLESVTQQLPSQIPNPDGSLPTAGPQPDSAGLPLLCLPVLPLSETSPPQPPPMNKATVNLDGPKAGPDPPDTQSQHKTSSEPVHPAPGSAPHSPPGASAVWKKNQGLACSRRILWEHTRGRYTCVQCGHTVTNRKDMTQHINSQHNSAKAAEDLGQPAAQS